MKLVKLKTVMGETLYVNPESIALLEAVNNSTIVHMNGGVVHFTVNQSIEKVVEMLEDKKHGSFDTDDFFHAAVENAYKKTD